MNWQAIALALGAAIFSHSTSFRVGPMRVTATEVGGAPAHFTFAAALLGAEQALAGEGGTFQSGNIQVVVDNWPV